MKTIYIALFLLFTSITNSQNHHCSFAGELNDNYYTFLQSNFSNDIEIENIIHAITNEVGLEKNFIYVNSPGLNNCAALNYDGFRYILYDKSFLNSLTNFSSNRISVYISVLAHEIGHHLQGHTLKNISEKDNKNSELEADKFSGYIMYKLGYTLSDAQEALQKIPNIYNSTHPLKNNRLLAIEEGFKSANLQIEKNKDQIKNNLFIEYYNKALDYYNEGEYQNAIDNSTTAITLNKNNNFFPITLRAISYSKSENYISALQDFKKLETIPMDDKKVIGSYLHFNKGVTLYAMEDYDEASKEFYHAYSMNNMDKIALMQLASNLSLAGNHLSALSFFETQLTDNDIQQSELQDFTKGDIFLRKAISYYETNKSEKAIEYFDLAQSLYPEKYTHLSHPYYYKGMLYEKNEDLDNAISNYLLFLKIYDKEQHYFFVNYNFAKANQVYYDLGLIYQQKQKYELSNKYLDKLINNGPELNIGYFFRGMNYYLMGNNSKAIVDINKSCELGNEKACIFLNNLNSEKTESKILESIIKGGYRTQKIIEYQYNLNTKEYDLVYEKNIDSELFFDSNGLAFKRGNNKWLFANWTYKGFDETNKKHIFYDNYNQSIVFDENLSTISWYAKSKNNVFQQIFVYQFLTKDDSVKPIQQK